MTDLREAEQAHERALSEANAARTMFEEKPSAKTHADMAVKEQLAHNAASMVEAARIDAEKSRRAELSKKLATARARASRDRLFADTAQQRARLLDIFVSALPIVREIEAAVLAQNEASDDAVNLAQQLGEYSDVDSPVSKDLLRAMTCVVLAQHLVDTNYRTPHAAAFYEWLRPRWDRGIGAPDQQLIREARQLALPSDVYTPTNPVDFSQSASDVGPWEATPETRPARWEV